MLWSRGVTATGGVLLLGVGLRLLNIEGGTGRRQAAGPDSGAGAHRRSHGADLTIGAECGIRAMTISGHRHPADRVAVTSGNLKNRIGGGLPRRNVRTLTLAAIPRSTESPGLGLASPLR